MHTERVQRPRKIADDRQIVIALGDGKLHRTVVRADEQRERLRRRGQHRAVIKHIGQAAGGQLELAHVGDEEAILQNEIAAQLLALHALFIKRHRCLVQLAAGIGRALGAVHELLRLHLVLQKRLGAAEHLVHRQVAVFGQIGQIDKADEIPGRHRGQQRPQIDRDLRNNRLFLPAELMIERAHEQRRDHGKRAYPNALRIAVQLGERKGHFAYDLRPVAKIGQIPRVRGFGLFPNALGRKLAVGELAVAVRRFLRRIARVHRADRAVVFHRLAGKL